MFLMTPDQSVTDSNGNLIYCSTDRFISDICRGTCCFLCGKSPLETKFNNEHVIPDWILRKYQMHKKHITLPNQTDFRYDQYKIPCCVNCNEILGRLLETPISKLVGEGYDAVVQHITTKGPWEIFVWLSLIFLKTHLKDLQLRYDRDHRSEQFMIGDTYALEELHHVHCIVRSIIVKSSIEVGNIGTLIVMPINQKYADEEFDYIDIYKSQSLLLRLGDIVMIAVLNDAGAALRVLNNSLMKISDLLTPLQTREILAHVSYINLQLSDRPKFGSRFDLEKGGYELWARHPSKVALKDHDPKLFGEIMEFCIKDIVVNSDTMSAEEIIKLQKEGKASFLFNENGTFLRQKV